MIKKLLISLGVMLVPVMAMAAYNSVSLGTSAVVSISDSLDNTITLNVTGSADVVESITVGSTSFSVTLQPSSVLTVTDSSRHLITVSGVPAANVSISCGSSSSSVTLTSVDTSDLTASVSVSPNACGSSSSSSSSTGSNGPVAQSGGGGGGSYVTPSTPSTPAAGSNEAMQAQITSLLALISSLQAQLGTPGAGTVGAGVSVFARNMNVGSKGADAMSLQRVLNADSDTQVSSSGAGSPGNETSFFGPATKKAVQKFQVKYGLAKPGDSGYGNFGPKTRAKMAEVARSKGL
ncbi:MAG TPA: peptidoglycan-binding protein [Candidatus Paceibacterota bacterium]